MNNIVRQCWVECGACEPYRPFHNRGNRARRFAANARRDVVNGAPGDGGWDRWRKMSKVGVRCREAAGGEVGGGGGDAAALR